MRHWTMEELRIAAGGIFREVAGKLAPEKSGTSIGEGDPNWKLENLREAARTAPRGDTQSVPRPGC